MSNGFLSRDDEISYSPLLARQLGVQAAILASQILKWQKDNPLGARKRLETMSAETGLTVNELRTARRKLREAGVLTEMRGERCMYYRIDELSLRAELDKVMS